MALSIPGWHVGACSPRLEGGGRGEILTAAAQRRDMRLLWLRKAAASVAAGKDARVGRARKEGVRARAGLRRADRRPARGAPVGRGRLAASARRAGDLARRERGARRRSGPGGGARSKS